MDRKRALEIFNLSEEPTKEAVVKRYNVLVKKVRHLDAESIGFTREELDEAYKQLMGLEYRDPEAEKRRMARQKRPNPIFKALGIDQDKLSNFIYYYKWYFLAGALALTLIVYIVVTVSSHVDPDLKVILAGEISVEDTAVIEESIKEVMDVEEPQVQHIPYSERMDPSSLVAFEQKLAVEIMAGKNDVYVLDPSLYRRFASFGIFVSLEDRLEEWGIESLDENLLVAVETEDGERYPPKQYGVDVSGSRLLRDQGIIGDTLIAVMTINSENTQNALEYIKALIESNQ